MLTISKDVIAPALDLAGKVIPTRPPGGSILGAVLLASESASGTTVDVYGTDCEVTVQQRVPVASGDLRDPIGIPFRPLRDFVKAAPKGAMIQIEPLDDNRARVAVVGGASITVDAYPHADWPQIHSFTPAPDVETVWHMGGTEAAGWLHPCLHAMGTDETRRYLNGTYFHHTAGELRAVALDGHRLVRSVACGLYAEGVKAIVPALAVKLMDAVARKAKDSTVTFAVTPTMAAMLTGGTAIYTKLIDAEYPQYERVIPTDDQTPHAIAVDAASLATLVAQAAAGGAKVVEIVLSPGEVTVRSGDNAGATIPCRHYRGPTQRLHVNARYLRDALALVSSGYDITLHVSDPEPLTKKTCVVDPVRFTVPNGAITGVIMPVRI